MTHAWAQGPAVERVKGESPPTELRAALAFLQLRNLAMSFNINSSITTGICISTSINIRTSANTSISINININCILSFSININISINVTW